MTGPPADELRALLAATDLDPEDCSKFVLDNGEAVLALLDAAQATSNEIQTDLPQKCLICAERDGYHVDDCPAEALAAALARLTQEAT